MKVMGLASRDQCHFRSGGAERRCGGSGACLRGRRPSSAVVFGIAHRAGRCLLAARALVGRPHSLLPAGARRGAGRRPPLAQYHLEARGRIDADHTAPATERAQSSPPARLGQCPHCAGGRVPERPRGGPDHDGGSPHGSARRRGRVGQSPSLGQPDLPDPCLAGTRPAGRPWSGTGRQVRAHRRTGSGTGCLAVASFERVTARTADDGWSHSFVLTSCATCSRAG